MADWDSIHCGFNAFDETINFGTRMLAGNDNLHEAVTLATITNSDSVISDTPNIHAVIKGGLVIFSINKTIRVFESLLCNNIVFNVSFDDEIDLICCNSLYMLLCLRNGEVYIFDLAEFNLMCRSSVFDVSVTSNPFFVGAFIEEMSDTSFVLICANGMVFRYSINSNNSDTDTLEDTCDIVTDLTIELQTAAFYNSSLFICGSNYFAVYDLIVQQIVFEDSVSYKKVYCLDTGKLLCLEHDGTLIIICTKTYQSYPININTLFDDISLVSESDGCCILGITVKDSTNNSYLQFLHFSDLTPIFSIKLLHDICLIMPEHIHDDILYISIVKNKDNISELRFHSVTETVPQNRLLRLIKRQKFDEAKQFASLFNLSTNDIEMAKAQSIADKLICETSDINNLLNVLESIDGNEFKVTTCLDVSLCCSTLEDVERVLKYGYMVAQSDDKMSDEYPHVYENISHSQFRYYIFKKLIGCGRSDNSVNAWNDFVVCELVDEVCYALKYNRIDEAIIICKNFDVVTINKLNDDTVTTILQLLCDLTVDYLPFLHIFIPSTLSYLPLTLSLFTKWMVKTVKTIEMKEPHKFPEKAFEFLENAVNILKINYLKDTRFATLHMVDQNELKELVDQLHALKLLMTLKKKYQISMPFQELTKGTCVLEQLLLNRSAIHILQDEMFFKEIMNTFVLDQEYVTDDIFSKVVKNIVEYQEELWIKIVPVILENIYSVDLKLESILHILKLAALPWSKSIHDIAGIALKYTHPLVQEIINEIDCEPKYIALNRKAYNIDMRSGLVDPKFIIDRMIYVNLPTMVDDIYLIFTLPEERHEANLSLMRHFIEQGKLVEALKILNNNKTEEIVKCCREILSLAKIIIASDNPSESNKRNHYYKIVGCLVKRLLQEEECDFHTELLQKTFDDIKCIYKTQDTFNINVTSSQLWYESERNKVLQHVIATICLEQVDITYTFSLLNKVSSYFCISQNEVLLKYCKQVGDFNSTIKACEKIIESDCDSQSLCHAVSILLKCVYTTSLEFKDTAQDFLLNNTGTTDFICNGLKLARNMVTKAILHNEDGDYSSCIQLADWVNAIYYLTQDFTQNYFTDLKNHYEMDLFTKPTATAVGAFVGTLKAYIECMGSHVAKDTKYLIHFREDILKDAQCSKLDQLFETIKSLTNEGQSFTAYRLMLMLQMSLVSHGVEDLTFLETMQEIIRYCIDQVQQKNFSLKRINKDFACCLLLTNREEARSIFRSNIRIYKRDLEKYKAIAEIYLKFLHYTSVDSGDPFCHMIIKMVYWWKRLKNCPIVYDKFFGTEPKKLLYRLIKVDQLDLSSIQRFCSDFNINVDDYYKEYFNYLLLNWRANIEISDKDRKIIVIKNNELDLYNTCLPVMQVIDDDLAILEIINSLWSIVSFYHYEVFICILNIQLLLNPKLDSQKQRMLLLFLKNYIRITNPGQTEIEEWFTMNPKSLEIDYLSEWRLPFTQTLFTNSLWNIIRPEVGLKTYTMWFDAISILKNLTKDDICSFAIKNVVTSGLLNTTTFSNWIFDSKHLDLIYEIKKCAYQIGNFEKATAAIYHLVPYFPKGVDLVSVISLCYEFVLKYQQQEPDSHEVEKAVKKVQNKYYNISVINILHKYKLSSKDYLDIVSLSPVKLIEALYMDERICQSATLTALYCPDINTTVDEIANLYKLDLMEIRYDMVNNWLLNSTNNIGSGENDHEDIVIRASYVCTSGKIEKWRKWLLEHSDGIISTNLSFKTRVLKCFCNISDAATVERLTQMTYKNFRKYIEKLTIANYLQCFGIGFTIEQLDSINKSILLDRLAGMGTLACVKTMGLICITYNIYSVKHWSVIISSMLNLDMVKELKDSIYFLKNQIQYYNERFYIDAWQRVVDKGFDFSYELTDEEKTNLCALNFSNLQLCPVVHSLNLENIAEMFIQKKKYEFVVLLLPHLPENTRSSRAMELLNKEEKILEKTKRLSDYGLHDVSQACTFFSEIID